MTVGTRSHVCRTPSTNLLQRQCTRSPGIPHHHNPTSTCDTRRSKTGSKRVKWSKMGANGWQFKCATSSMHKKVKKLVMEQQTCEKARVQAVAERKNFALCMHCVNVFPWSHFQGSRTRHQQCAVLVCGKTVAARRQKVGNTLDVWYAAIQTELQKKPMVEELVCAEDSEYSTNNRRAVH